MTTAPSPPEILLGLSTAHLSARALQLVAELGLADHLDEGARPVTDLADELGVDADALDRVLRLLETHGIFQRDANGCAHTQVSRWLRSDHPTSVRAFARMSYSPFNWGSVTHLEHAVRTGEAGICQLDPAGWSSYLDGHPAESAVFQQAMTAKAHDDIAAVLDVYDFCRHRVIVDVGGGRGHLISTVLAAHPSTSGVLFELPTVAADVSPGERLGVVAGDFFRDPLPGADAYLLMNIIHDWDDERAAAILEAVAEAGRSQHASVLLLEVLLPDTPAPHWAKTLDVLMLAITGGRERTLLQYRALLDRAGIELIGVTPTATPFSLVEGRVR